MNTGTKTASQATAAGALRRAASQSMRMALSPSPGMRVTPAKTDAVGDGAPGTSAVRTRRLLASGGERGRPRQAARVVLTLRRSEGEGEGRAVSRGPRARSSVARSGKRSAVGELTGQRRGAASMPGSWQSSAASTSCGTPAGVATATAWRSWHREGGNCRLVTRTQEQQRSPRRSKPGESSPH